VIVDCDTCTVRGPACGDCVVTFLLGPPAALDADEQRALGVLAESGLVPPLRLVPIQSPIVSQDTSSAHHGEAV
jgi:hypothetical protein